MPRSLSQALLASCVLSLLSSSLSFCAERGASAPDSANFSPEEAARRMSLPPGFSVTLFAGEPDVKQPVAFAIDDRGRLWVAENYSYPVRQPEGQGHDRILIFEDTDGDGKFDKRTLFANDLNMVTGIELGFGGVWVGAAPYLLFIPVRAGEDKPSGPPQIVLDGWGFQDTHNTLSTFVWGPDGWLYGGHGVACFSKVGKPGSPDSERVIINGGIWRYHPTAKKFERFSEGATNPWGIDFDERGQLFITGCVLPHLWHIPQGSRSQRLFGMNLDPHSYGEIKTIADHRHWAGENSHAGRDGYRDANGELKLFPDDYNVGGGHAHAGGMIYLGDNWPDEYRGRIFMNNLHGHRINMDILERKGSGFVGHHGADFLFTRDRWSLILNLQYGPDGSVYMIDFYEKNLCHNPTPALFDRSNGRIYRIPYGTPKPVTVDLQKLDDLELVRLQSHKNEWFARHGRRILQERAAVSPIKTEAREALLKMLQENPDPALKLHALWALHAIHALTEEMLLAQLHASDEYVRGWAIQLLCENAGPSLAALKQLGVLAREDTSPVVRLYLAAALQRIPIPPRKDILIALISRGEDASDQNLPLMYWWAAEPVVAQKGGEALALLKATKIPKVREFITRRLAE